ncbi:MULTISPECIES: phosphoenolpyruvate--protein phosphotransferase [unclassified Paenibacillus]|uniref:phosphoenolpyruvate--protein phosphotransferase n=1 Tax=unclassified Paenibacillus TaxID=185978 RepID=UPI001C10FA05|nr:MULTISPECIES: phosphoenolpyruvate--protein phosphotransferase [unclassified Paenibacillus]MBU5440595.1 phosphoenolpyruvate--protein phosphotransferase [Paenibacillus sp. MSJ-34]CAH0120061.1 Phosphoenolpyruvate-protein phosphotransferase [Paenibacillus sp. CECT 9249]
MIQGIGASTGIAIGRAFVLPTWEWDLPEQKMDAVDLAKEFERLYEGIRTSKNEIEFLKNEIREIVGPEQSSIFDAHLAILDDPVFMNEIQGIIERQYKAAEVAVKEAIDHFVMMFDLLDDEYMKERALDIKDVGNRLLKHLLGAPEITLPSDNQPYILVAKELSPSQLANLNPNNVLGLVTMLGGKTSHAAIMARALGIPLVLGLEGKLMQPIQTGDMLVIDGGAGTINIHPSDKVLERYAQLQRDLHEEKNRLERLAHVPSVTPDGAVMRLSANISSAKELDLALKHGATGVGLFRTEFLYMDRSQFPNEDEQFEVYRSVVERLGEESVVIRTLDIGGDKHLDYFDLPEEDNPALGYRAIRVCLDRKEMFKTQLRAILRASRYGNVKVMFPMISSIDEAREAKRLLEEAKQELEARGEKGIADIPAGIMIEVPAAVAIADLLAEEVDFFSIGTNDLVQYVLAVDRMNEQIAHMYEPFHPAILRMLRTIVEAARNGGIPISVCGEMAGDERAVPIWLAMGVRNLSMSAHSILRVKNRILQTDSGACAEFFPSLFECRTNGEVEQLLDTFALE